MITEQYPFAPYCIAALDYKPATLTLVCVQTEGSKVSEEHAINSLI